MDHEEIKTLLAAEAAGALGAGEGAPLDEHLASCAECRRELEDLREVAAAIAYAVEPITPPAHLRARILESIHAPSTKEATRAAAPSSDGLRAGAAGRPSADEVRRLVRRLGWWELFGARPALGFAAAAAILLAAALGVATVSLRGTNRSLRAEAARLAERLDEARQESARERTLLAETRAVNELLTAPGAQFAQLAGTKVAPGAVARVAYDRATGRAVLAASDLPPAPAGKAYQLWFIAGGRPLPGAVFTSGLDGRALHQDTAPAGAGEVSAFAVTLEDEGGAPAPRGEMYLISSAS